MNKRLSIVLTLFIMLLLGTSLAIGADNTLSAEGWFNKARQLSIDKLYSKAIDAFDSAIKLNTKYARAHIGRGLAFYALRQYDKAISDYTKAIEIEPKYAGSYNNRGLVYADLRQYDKAIEDYTKAIELDPKFTLAYYNRGIEYENLRLYDKAIKDYTRAIELNPKDSKAYNYRAFVYKKLRLYDKAIKDYTRAIELDPGFASDYVSRGYAYKAKGEDKRAIADFNKSIQLQPDNEYAYLWLINSSRSSSSKTLSRSQNTLKEFVNKNPSDQWIRTVSKYYLSIISEDEVLTVASMGNSDEDIKGQLCEAYYYLAEVRLAGGDIDGAAQFYKKSIDTGVSGFVEYTQSKAALILMKKNKR